MTTPEDFGVPPEVLAQAQNAADAARPFIDNASPVLAILARQHDAMEEMRRSFQVALQMQPAPQTRQALALLVHQLRAQPLPAAVLASSTQRVEQAVVALLPQNDEEVEQVRQGVGEIEATPEFSEKLRRLVSGINPADIAELTAWGALVWVAQRLFQVADWPVTEHLSADQIAALQNRLMVLAVMVAIAQIIIMMRRR